MSNFVDVIQMCEKAGGAGTKKDIQAALKGADKIARRLIVAAMNPYAVYGVRKYEMPATSAKAADFQQNYELFFQLLDDLASKKLTGNSAKEAIWETFHHFNARTQDYLTRIFDKDLRAGFSASTANKIWAAEGHVEQVPSFEVMLAAKCEEVEDFEKNVTFPCVAETKLDGERNVAVVKADSVTYYSRSGKEATHVNGLFDSELQKIRAELGYDFIMDGERFASDFTESMNAKKAGNDAAKANLRFHAFFLMPLTDWIAQKTSITMKANREALFALLKKVGCVKIVPTKGRIVENYEDMMTYCNEVIDVDHMEGLILKDLESPYRWDRDFAWTKVKRFYDADCRVMGFYPGRPKSRLENTLGGLIVAGFLESGERVEVNVGSGFTDEQRAEIWNHQEEWLGKTVVVKYQEVSRAKGKTVASLRFPVFLHARDDKTVEIE